MWKGTVAKRIDVYEKETMPLVEYYTAKGNIVTIKGDQAIDKVFEEIQRALGSKQ